MLTDQQERSTDSQEHGSHKLTIHGAKNMRKTTYMLLTVIVVFLICMLPFQIMVLVAPFVHADVLRSDTFFVSTKISSVLAVCSMACNPFIYSFFREKFRRAFTDVGSNAHAKMTANRRSLSLPLFCLAQQFCENSFFTFFCRP